MCAPIIVCIQSLSLSLDLDKWINDPPSDDEEEEEELKTKGSFFFASADADRHRGLGGDVSPTVPRSKKERKKARKAEREQEEEMEKVRPCVQMYVSSFMYTVQHVHVYNDYV